MFAQSTRMSLMTHFHSATSTDGVDAFGIAGGIVGRRLEWDCYVAVSSYQTVRLPSKLLLYQDEIMGRILAVIAVVAVGLVLFQPQPVSYGGSGVQAFTAPPQLCVNGMCEALPQESMVYQTSEPIASMPVSYGSAGSLAVQSSSVSACGGYSAVYRRAPVRSWAANRRTPIRSTLLRSRSRRSVCGG